jgi:hypothetical protein
MPMKRVWGHGLTGLVLLVGVAGVSAGGPACVHDDSTIFVSDVLAPQYVTAGMACVFTADPTQPVLASGALDVQLASSYSAVFLVGNQLVPRGDPNQPQTETSFVVIAGAVVRIVDSTGTQLNTYTQPAAATIPPSSGTTPGYASLGLEIIDPTTALGFFGSADTVPVVSYVRFFGHTLGGESVESNEFGFPVNICNGCLVSFPLAEQENNLPTPNCALGGAASSGSSASVPCVLGQDLAVDCSACQQKAFCRQNQGVVTPIGDAGGGG